MYRVIAGLNVASAMGIAEMMALPNEPQLYIMLTTCVTVLGSVTLQMLNSRQENRRREADRIERQEHREEMKRIAEESKVEIMAGTVRQAKLLQAGIDSNTDLTRFGIQQTEEFAKVANHVNEKIANIAAAAVSASVPLVKDIKDTNDTVHRIEDKS